MRFRAEMCFASELISITICMVEANSCFCKSEMQMWFVKQQLQQHQTEYERLVQCFRVWTILVFLVFIPLQQGPICLRADEDCQPSC